MLPRIAFGAGFVISGVINEAKAKPKTKAGKKAKMAKSMHDFKHGKMHSGKNGPVVTNRKQAVAIGMNQSGQSRKK
jgi:Family of unknown function (DUF6496)